MTQPPSGPYYGPPQSNTPVGYGLSPQFDTIQFSAGFAAGFTAARFAPPAPPSGRWRGPSVLDVFAGMLMLICVALVGVASLFDLSSYLDRWERYTLFRVAPLAGAAIAIIVAVLVLCGLGERFAPMRALAVATAALLFGTTVATALAAADPFLTDATVSQARLGLWLLVAAAVLAGIVTVLAVAATHRSAAATGGR